jgi:hypothetical protein
MEKKRRTMVTADVPEAPWKPWLWMQRFIRAVEPRIEAAARADDKRQQVAAPVAPAAKPPAKRNVKFMLRWCRAKIPGFKDCEARALAAKGGGKAGK